MLATALAVAAQIVYRILVPATPLFEAMTAVVVLALAANCTWLLVLWRHRHDDINKGVRLGMLPQRHRVEPGGVFGAGAVALFGSGWPDLLVAVGLGVLLPVSACRVIRRSIHGLAHATPPAAAPPSRAITLHRRS